MSLKTTFKNFVKLDAGLYSSYYAQTNLSSNDPRLRYAPKKNFVVFLLKLPTLPTDLVLSAISDNTNIAQITTWESDIDGTHNSKPQLMNVDIFGKYSLNWNNILSLGTITIPNSIVRINHWNNLTLLGNFIAVFVPINSQGTAQNISHVVTTGLELTFSVSTTPENTITSLDFTNVKIESLPAGTGCPLVEYWYGPLSDGNVTVNF